MLQKNGDLFVGFTAKFGVFFADIGALEETGRDQTGSASSQRRVGAESRFGGSKKCMSGIKGP